MPPPPDPPALREAAARATGWLLTAAASATDAAPLADLLALLVGVRSGAAVAPGAGSSPATENLLDRISARLSAGGPAVVLPPDALDPAFVLACHHFPGEPHARCARSEALRGRLAAALADPPSPLVGHPAGDLVLARSGRGPRSGAVGPGPAGSVGADPSLIRASRHQVQAVCRDVVAATLLGGERPGPEVARGDTLPTLSVLVLSALRDYDLELGATLLQTIGCVRAEEAWGMGNVIQFLLAQQQDDGRFGYDPPQYREGGHGRDATATGSRPGILETAAIVQSIHWLLQNPV